MKLFENLSVDEKAMLAMLFRVIDENAFEDISCIFCPYELECDNDNGGCEIFNLLLACRNDTDVINLINQKIAKKEIAKKETFEVVINNGWGLFELPEEIIELIGTDSVFDASDEVRTNPVLIDYVKNHKDETDLGIAYVPKAATDWAVDDHDGIETVIAVVDGSLKFIECED